MWVPRDRCIPLHRVQSQQPIFTETHFGFRVPQSAHILLLPSLDNSLNSTAHFVASRFFANADMVGNAKTFLELFGVMLLNVQNVNADNLAVKVPNISDYEPISSSYGCRWLNQMNTNSSSFLYFAVHLNRMYDSSNLWTISSQHGENRNNNCWSCIRLLNRNRSSFPTIRCNGSTTFALNITCKSLPTAMNSWYNKYPLYSM